MAVKKSELYQRIWASCDALRGGMDASQYKDYVLTMLFIKYVSDKAKGAKFPEIKVPKGASFDDMLKFRNKSDIGDLINKKVIGKIDKENELAGILTKVDFNNTELLGTGKEMVERLTELVSIFHSNDLDFSKNKSDGDDVLGDAYEFLMKHFATQSGKSKGQFYTPSEVSRILAKVIGVTPKNVKANTTVYDPTCGSGSLLLKVAAETNNKVTLFGQEKDVSTAGLAKMNMVLHKNAVALKNIMDGNTLSDPKHKTNGELTQFDYVVANPPFSDKFWSTGLTPSSDEHGRFQDFGCPPNKNGDYAYLLHILRSLKSKGKGAVILPHGVLFRGNAEEEIRKNLVKRGYIKAIIGLPANLFYGTGIPACIILLDKEEADKREGIFMINAGKGFVKDGNKNKLQEKDIHKIIEAYQKQENIPGFSRFVENKEIKENEYNLNIPRFIESTDEEIKQDIEAHLLGGIPDRDVQNFEDFWKECPGIKKELFKKSAREGYYDLKIDKNQIRQTIFDHSEFKDFSSKSHVSFAKWIEQSKKKLEKFKEGGHPKELIFEISEELLEAFPKEGLINKYNVYQSLMTYWEEEMQDEVYAISADSWKVAQEFKRIKTDKGKAKKGIEGLEGILIPPMLLAKVKLSDLVSQVDEKTEELEKLNQAMFEVISENSGDEAIFDDIDEGKVPGAKYFKSKLDKVKLIIFSTLFKDKSNKLEAIKNERQALLDKIAELDLSDANGEGYLDDKVRNKQGVLSISSVGKLVKSEHEVTGKSQLDDSWVSSEKDELFFALITKNIEIKDLDKQFKSIVAEMNESFSKMTDVSGEEIDNLKIVEDLCTKKSNYDEIKKEKDELKNSLEEKIQEEYPKLSEKDIKLIVIEKKWLEFLSEQFESEIEKITYELDEGVQSLVERYESTLPSLLTSVSNFEKLVFDDLKSMGFSW